MTSQMIPRSSGALYVTGNHRPGHITCRPISGEVDQCSTEQKVGYWSALLRSRKNLHRESKKHPRLSSAVALSNTVRF